MGVCGAVANRRFDDFQKLSGRFPLPSLPPRKGTWIDAELFGKIPLSDAEGFSVIDQSLRHSGTLFKWIVAQEFYHCAHVFDARLCVVLLPIDDRHFIAADERRYVLLMHSQVETTCPQCIADRPNFFRVCPALGLFTL